MSAQINVTDALREAEAGLEVAIQRILKRDPGHAVHVTSEAKALVVVRQALSQCNGCAVQQGYVPVGAVAQIQDASRLPEIKDMLNSPQTLNNNDRAFWVLGWNECRDAAKSLIAHIAELEAQLAAAQQGVQPFQERAGLWLMECFGHDIAHDGIERNHRFLEESLELVQSLGCTASEAHQLVGYVFGRPVGEPRQELGGVMVTLAALCFAHGLDMQDGGEAELARISVPEIMAKVKAKQAAKPKHSPLPQHPTQQGLDALTKAASSVLAERARQIAAEGYTPEQDDGYNPGVLALHGGLYACHAYDNLTKKRAPEGWQWDEKWWKPKDPRSNLVKAGALVLAEIERIDRVCAAQAKQGLRATGYIAPKGRYVPPALFNPYSGEPRDARDIASDPHGVLIIPPGAAIAAQTKQGGV